MLSMSASMQVRIRCMSCAELLCYPKHPTPIGRKSDKLHMKCFPSLNEFFVYIANLTNTVNLRFTTQLHICKRVESSLCQSIILSLNTLFTNLIMRMENLKMLLTIGTILIVPVILMPQFFIGLLILFVACIAFRQRNF